MVEKMTKSTEPLGDAVKKSVSEVSNKVSSLDSPLIKDKGELNIKKPESSPNIKDLDKPLNNSIIPKTAAKMEKKAMDGKSEGKEINKPKMEPPVVIEFKCPEGMDRREFTRQLKAQERGLNSQTVAENMDNREAFNRRKQETGNGRDVTEGKKAQDIARQKAYQSRIESNQKKGMSYGAAKAEADGWISKQAALHNPDQIAGGDPSKVSRMGDAAVNSSIGGQWRTRVDQLASDVDKFAAGKSRAELENTRMNVKLIAS